MIDKKIKLKKILGVLVLLILIIFLGFNIFFSQTISPLYLGMVAGQKSAVASYLKKIITLPEFKNELRNYKKIYGSDLEDKVFQEERERQKKIIQLEEILNKNNQARDVLYELYLLNKADGNDSKAGEYLNRARAIDPTIKN